MQNIQHIYMRATHHRPELHFSFNMQAASCFLVSLRGWISCHAGFTHLGKALELEATAILETLGVQGVTFHS